MSQTKQILIAEDDNFMRTLLEAQCRNLGMQTHAVPDGAEAVTEALSYQYDILLMDIQMPNLDGLQACKQIRQWEMEQQKTMLPVIALTASVLDEDKTAAKDAGMQGFASKPINFNALCFEIARVLGLQVQEPLSSTESAEGSSSTNPEQLVDYIMGYEPEKMEKKWIYRG